MKFRILNSREIKQIHKLMESQWGPLEDIGMPLFNGEYVFLRNEKNKIFLINRAIEGVEYDRMRINSLGLYLGEIKFGMRLSIEGSQIVGPKATTNVVELSTDQFKEWIKGNSVNSKEGEGFVIVKYNGDFFGTGKAKNGEILNYIPKTRRIMSL